MRQFETALEVPNALSLVTYNIHKGFGLGKKRFLLPQMREALVSLNPDLVFLQEVQGVHLKREKRIAAWPDGSQYEYMADSQWPHYVYAKNATYQSGHHGNAILSKYPFEQARHLNWSLVKRASRGLIHGELLLGNATVHLLCVHLGLFKAERKGQCQALIQHIRDWIPEQAPLILAGDFNDWRKRLSEPLAGELGIHEAFISTHGAYARSFPSIRPSLCVDRIYYRHLNIEGVQCLRGKPWQSLSDHIPLFAKFYL